MGNLCACCLRSDPEEGESLPRETTELLQQRSRPAERDVRSYDSILETTTSNFLSHKSKGRTTSSEGSGQKVRSVRSNVGELPITGVSQSPPTSVSGRDIGFTGATKSPRYTTHPTAEPAVQMIAQVIASTLASQHDSNSASAFTALRTLNEDGHA